MRFFRLKNEEALKGETHTETQKAQAFLNPLAGNLCNSAVFKYRLSFCPTSVALMAGVSFVVASWADLVGNVSWILFLGGTELGTQVKTESRAGRTHSQ